MTTDTRHPRFTPKRPNLPIEDRRFEVWREHYEARLLRYFRDLEPDAWDRMTRATFDLQRIADQKNFELGRELL